MKQLFILFLITGATASQCQNLMDEQGRKTGYWKVEYPGGNILYEAQFQEGKPVGEMVRYYENGAVRARMMFDSIEDKSFTRLYYKNSKQAAEGWHVKKVKDSVWTYYSEFDGSVRIREPYQNGNLHGSVTSFYPNGIVSEEVNWQHNMKKGAWKQFFDNGTLRLVCGYENDLLTGTYELFYPESNIKVRGEYLENRKNEIWRFFDEKGEEIYTLEYLLGKIVDQEKYLQLMADSLKRYEHIIEPETIDSPRSKLRGIID